MIKNKPIKVLIIIALIFSYSGYSKDVDSFSAINIKQLKGKDKRGRYSIQYPYFRASLDADKLNDFLKKMSIACFLCEEDRSKQKEMYANVTVKPGYLSKKLFSYSLQYDSYCGGPYPEKGVLYVIVDIKNGKYIDVTKQFKDTRKFYRLLYAQFQKQRPKNYEKNCKHLIIPEELSQTSFNYLLKDKALIARLNYAHVARACEYNIKIPCSLMVPNLNQNSLLVDYCSTNAS